MGASAWSEAAAGIRVRQSRAYRMNTVVLEHPEQHVIVDPGVLPSELDDLARATAAAPPAAVTLFFTHGDWDHVLGKPWWPDASTIAHDRFAAEVKARREKILADARATAEEAGERWERGFEPFRPDLAISGLHFTKLGPWRVVFRDAYGHSASMLSLHLPESGVLIAADMLSDIEIPLLSQGPAIYRKTLLELLTLGEGGAIETIVPGHGSIARGRDAALERLQRDLGYLDELERRVGEARAAGLDLESAVRTLEAMEYLGKRGEPSMVEGHRENVRVAYRTLTGRSS
jgi:glyoxylase-like metal-dependent hydrolase (beta-lactamase superfamily II)